jgi:uncharacterized protein GlcG (DUF336 family)
VAHAAKLGVKINVALADSGGNLTGFLRMPGAFSRSISPSTRPTPRRLRFLDQGLDEGDRPRRGMKLGFSARPRLVVFGGGLPVRVAGS